MVWGKVDESFIFRRIHLYIDNTSIWASSSLLEVIRIRSKHLRSASPANFMNSRNCFDFKLATKSELFGYVVPSCMLIGIFYIYSQWFHTFLIICVYDNINRRVATNTVHERFKLRIIFAK